jgi:hypothetical protein
MSERKSRESFMGFLSHKMSFLKKFSFVQNSEKKEEKKTPLEKDLEFENKKGCSMNFEMDEEEMRIAMKNKVSPSSYLSSRMRKNMNIALISVSIDCESIEYFDRSLRDDECLMLNVVSQNGMMLKFASNRLKNLNTLVLRAYLSDPNSIIHASDRYYNEPHLLIVENFGNLKFHDVSFKFI